MANKYCIRSYMYGMLFLDTTKIKEFRRFNQAIYDMNFEVIEDGIEEMLRDADLKAYINSPVYRFQTDEYNKGEFDLKFTEMSRELKEGIFGDWIGLLKEVLVDVKNKESITDRTALNVIKDQYLQKKLSIFSNSSHWVLAEELYTTCIDFGDLANKDACSRFEDYDLLEDKGNEYVYAIALEKEVIEEIIQKIVQDRFEYKCTSIKEKPFLLEALGSMLNENRVMVLVYSG